MSVYVALALNNGDTTMKKITQSPFLLLLFFLYLSPLLLLGEEKAEAIPSKKQTIDNASWKLSKKLLRLSPKETIEEIKGFNIQKIKTSISQIRYLTRDRNPDIDRLYLLLKALENLEATKLAQKRLNNLLWVIGLSLLLFSSFLFYLWWDQKKCWQRLEKAEKVKPSKPKEVYKGD